MRDKTLIVFPVQSFLANLSRFRRRRRCCLKLFPFFIFLLQNNWTISNQLWHKASLSKGDSSLFIRQSLYRMKDNSHWWICQGRVNKCQAMIPHWIQPGKQSGTYLKKLQNDQLGLQKEKSHINVVVYWLRAAYKTWCNFSSKTATNDCFG